MRLRSPLPLTTLALVLHVLDVPLASATSWTAARKLEMREATRGLWYHAYHAYMDFAFPMDELRPLSCTGRGPDWDNPKNTGTNDVAGNYSITLVDVLDTFPVMDDKPGFEEAVRWVIDWVQYNVDTKPQVFEVTIRALGGLLSGHIFASEGKFKLDWYRGELLALAKDLGERLLPAFDTPTGLPWARINLRRGVPLDETTQTCTAGAGSLILEFGTLSRLTGDDRFEKAAFKAFFAVWNRRADTNLVGNAIDTKSGAWNHPDNSNVGAGIDSFYEYALKWYVLSGEVEFLDVWNEAYAAVMKYTRGVDGYWMRTVNMSKGTYSTTNIDSLSAFWPGLQVLAGDIQNAIKSHIIYWNLWRRYHGMPEMFDVMTKTVRIGGYPLRPEFIESTYFLYRATRDTFYLDVGMEVLDDLTSRSKVKCGLATLADVETDELDDRMESFVLSETLKYLYLLFDEANEFSKLDSNFIFTTEGHILLLNSTHLHPISETRRRARRHERPQCPVHQPVVRPHTHGLFHGIRSRPEYEYARHLAGNTMFGDVANDDSGWWDAHGICEVPKIDIFTYDFFLAKEGTRVTEDTSVISLQSKVLPWVDGLLFQNASGVRIHATSRLDGRGYDITKIGHVDVRAGTTVYFNDSSIFENGASHIPQRPTAVPVTFYLKALEDEHVLFNDANPGTSHLSRLQSLSAKAWTSNFGLDPRDAYLGSAQSTDPESLPPPRFSRQGSRLVHYPENGYGCDPFLDPSGRIDGSMVLVKRGECYFIDKLAHARQAGAAGAIVWQEDDEHIRPSAEPRDFQRLDGVIEGATLLAIGSTEAQQIGSMLRFEDAQAGKVEVWVRLDDRWQEDMDLIGVEGAWPPDQPTKTQSTVGRMLYVNGHALVNTVLLF